MVEYRAAPMASELIGFLIIRNGRIKELYVLSSVVGFEDGVV